MLVSNALRLVVVGSSLLRRRPPHQVFPLLLLGGMLFILSLTWTKMGSFRPYSISILSIFLSTAVDDNILAIGGILPPVVALQSVLRVEVDPLLV